MNMTDTITRHPESANGDKALREAQSLISQLPKKMLPVAERLHAIVSEMTPDVRRSFIPVLRQEVQDILDGQNEFSIRITLLMAANDEKFTNLDQEAA
jgi:hypothetical protein